MKCPLAFLTHGNDTAQPGQRGSKQVVVPIQHISHRPNEQTEKKIKHPCPSTSEETYHDPAILRLEKPAPPAYRRPNRECSGKGKQKENDISSGT